MSLLDTKIERCTLCPLSESRTKAVPGAGSIKKGRVVFVGEAPGRSEDLSGRPFVGRAGKVLNSIFETAGIARDEIYITNIVKCRPPKNKKPMNEEVKICTENYLEKQIKILKPKLVCTLGATALEYFTGQKKMAASRGKVTRTKTGLWLFPTYHPASALRNKSHKEILESDIKKIPQILTFLREKED